MSVGISFGSATSGDGFDVASTVASIMAVERTPETAWATRTTALTSQDAVLSSLGTDLSTLSTALSSLTSFDGVFSAMTGATSDSSTVALTNVGSTATAGTHTFTVQSLAATSTYHSSLVTSSSTVSGTLSLQVGSGTPTSVAINSGSTLLQVATQINASSAGVQATVITGSNGSYLSLVSGTSGAGGSLTIDSSGLSASSGAPPSFTQTTAGADAAYTLDGVSLTSASNTVSTALKGVTFQLLQTTGSSTSTSSSVVAQVVADTSSVSTSLGSFVSAYNTLVKALAAQETNDSTGAAEPLFGNPLVSQIQSSLSAALSATNVSSASSSGTPLSLISLGITTGVDGTLSLDASTLTSALSSNLGGIESFFQTAGNFGQNLNAALSSLGSSGTGAIGLATASNATEETQLATNKSDLELRLTAYQTSLTTELTTANEILQSIPSTLKGITSLFDAITGNTNG